MGRGGQWLGTTAGASQACSRGQSTGWVEPAFTEGGLPPRGLVPPVDNVESRGGRSREDRHLGLLREGGPSTKQGRLGVLQDKGAWKLSLPGCPPRPRGWTSCGLQGILWCQDK